MPPPWTQTISVAWRPELRFYEKRIEILRAFQDNGDLTAFRVKDDQADARLFGGACFLSVRQNGLSLQLRGADADLDRGWEAAASAVSDLEPSLPRLVSVSFQYVEGLELSFEDAVARGYARLFSGMPRGSLRFDDWALLTDLELADPAASGLIEFGIVRDSELLERLTRQVGRAGDGNPAQGFRWDESTFPSVAVFADVTLRGDVGGAIAPDALLDAVKTFWEGCRAEMDTLVSSLHERLTQEERVIADE